MPNTFDIGAIGAGAATQAAEGLVGAGMGLLLEKHNDKRQIKQQQKLTDMQMKANKDMALFNYDQQMKMWEATNYNAQKKQLEKAGLNPGLLYGMSGGGGATTSAAQGGSASAGSAPTGGGEIMGMLSQKMQLALLEAQKENIEADTKNKQANTAKTAGVDTELAEQNIENIAAGTENTKAETILKKIGAQIQAIDFKLKSETYTAAKAQIQEQANIALQQLNILRNEAVISENTWMQKIDLINSELAGKLLDNQATRAGIELTEQQTKKVIQDIQNSIKQLQQGNRALDQKDQDILIDKARNSLIETGIWVGAASGVARDMINLLTRKAGGQ